VPAGSPEFRVKVPLLHSKRKYNSADLTTSMASAEFMFLHYANLRVFENLMGGQLPEPPEKVYCEKCERYQPKEVLCVDMTTQTVGPHTATVIHSIENPELKNKNNDCKDYGGKNDVPK